MNPIKKWLFDGVYNFLPKNIPSDLSDSQMRVRVSRKLLLAVFTFFLIITTFWYWANCSSVSVHEKKSYLKEPCEQSSLRVKKVDIINSDLFHDENDEDDLNGQHVNLRSGLRALEEIECSINDEYTVPCRQENNEVYLPFSFIHKYFEVYGKIVKHGGIDRFNWQHSYSKVYYPKQKYNPNHVFLWFENYNVEVRDRVKCISGIEGVPVSTQWDTRGHYYPIQIAQFGLSHFSKNLTEAAPSTVTIEDGETTLHGKWLYSKHNRLSLRKIYDAVSGSTVLEFKTKGPGTEVSLSLEEGLEETTLNCDLMLIANASLTVVLSSTGDQTLYKIHYVMSDTLMTVSDFDVYYGIGTSIQWKTLTRDLFIDLNKGLPSMQNRRKISKPRGLQIRSLILSGYGRIDNISLTSASHMAHFFAAANWFLNHQDENGGWANMVTRKLSNGMLELAPGWYSAMAQGQAMSLLTRAFKMENGEKGKAFAIPMDTKTTCLTTPEENVNEENSKRVNDITYKLDDVPSWYLCFILGLQHYLTMIGGSVTYPYLIAPHLCIPDNDPARGYLVATAFFVSGVCTFIQTTFGVRLPIVQGSSMAFLVPIIAIMNLPQWECPDFRNQTIVPDPVKDEIWMSRMREVQGAIIGASLFEVLIGFTGMMGFLLNWITPLSIVPTVSLVGLSLFAEVANTAAGNWGVSIGTIVLLVIFSQYLKNVNVPYPKYIPKNGWKMHTFPFFKLFPVLLTILISWSICAILTNNNVFLENNPARTDIQLPILRNSPWIRVPYPGQWGLPTFSTAAVFGVLAGVLASAIESVGDYYACARLSGAPPPPKHAINRGILIEGVGCVISGLFGTGGGVTSFSENIGAIGITKVASRRVIQFGSILMILFGMLGKFGALFMTIPAPIIGGIFCTMFSVISAVGLSALHYVDLNSSRNLFILGFSLFMGLCIPKWMQANPGVINTGNETADQILIVLLSTSMLVGGLIGFLLDNTIPGTDEERGILKWKKHDHEGAHLTGNTSIETYDIPYVKKLFRNLQFFKYFPASPSYDEGIIKSHFIKWKKGVKSKEISVPMSSRL